MNVYGEWSESGFSGLKGARSATSPAVKYERLWGNCQNRGLSRILRIVADYGALFISGFRQVTKGVLNRASSIFKDFQD